MDDILIIEKGYDTDYSIFLQFPIFLTIVLIYTYLSSYIINNELLGYDCIKLQYQKLTEYNKKTNENEYYKDIKNYNNARKEFENKQIIYVMIFALLSIIGGMLLTKYDNTFTVGSAIATSGGIYIFALMYLDKLDKTFTILILGLTLITLSYLSLKNS